ncbi:cytochrome b subunit of succinate dehydrogenase, Sdh3p [Fusarium chlamydosporum]
MHTSNSSETKRHPHSQHYQPDVDSLVISKFKRLNRPVTPNLSIYKIEQIWFSASAWTRITGLIVGGTAYLVLGAHAVAPYLGLGFDSTALVSAFGALPFAAKATIKFVLGFPFSYHFFNGIRHLVFDLGVGYKKAQFKKSEAATWALSMIGGLVLAFWL